MPELKENYTRLTYGEDGRVKTVTTRAFDHNGPQSFEVGPDGDHVRYEYLFGGKPGTPTKWPLRENGLVARLLGSTREEAERILKER